MDLTRFVLLASEKKLRFTKLWVRHGGDPYERFGRVHQRMMPARFETVGYRPSATSRTTTIAELRRRTQPITASAIHSDTFFRVTVAPREKVRDSRSMSGQRHYTYSDIGMQALRIAQR